ncbi:hypothetical protein CEXT_363321 [Caerostris extrusa]|uniref:Uncharacterized protein n=1 Tax=Caerostris extrusa TaxID=172846 RepID=A0AAV4PFQ6_CAEEX|nr:hypothetical protein CEXT_363321 [Caerostris extrusa]
MNSILFPGKAKNTVPASVLTSLRDQILEKSTHPTFLFHTFLFGVHPKYEFAYDSQNTFHTRSAIYRYFRYRPSVFRRNTDFKVISAEYKGKIRSRIQTSYRLDSLTLILSYRNPTPTVKEMIDEMDETS